ncbi:MAG: histidine phosphatase family protein [Sphingomicrobium sp.]
MPQREHWPERLWLVRHGQSQGNIARVKAEDSNATSIDLAMRDVDVPLSPLGHLQAEAVGAWFARLPDEERPELLISSPYVRARQTAETICNAGGLAGGSRRWILDERLREREFGVFDGLTPRGIAEKFPEEAAHRAKLGKFYHRAPGGESWADVILRLRSMLNTINLQYGGKRVLLIAHQVVVMCLRYILDEMTEEELLALNRLGEVLNCGISSFDFDPLNQQDGRPRLTLWNYGAPLEQAGAESTAEREQMTGSR